jgi:hypothetical protein
MKRRIFFFTLLLYLPLSAEEFGDFAPLVVGTVWVYICTYYSGYDYEKWVVNDTTTLTVTLVNSITIGDTIVHCFQSSDNGTRTIDTTSDQNPPTVQTIADTSYDTLYEVNNKINRTKIWGFSFTPSFNWHYIDDATARTFSSNPISFKDGEYEFYYKSYTGIYYEYTYRTGKGLINYKEYGTMHNASGSYEATLLSLTNNPDVISSVHQKTTDNIRRHPISPATRYLSLPNLTITRDDKTFNLLGRVLNVNRVSRLPPVLNR